MKIYAPNLRPMPEKEFLCEILLGARRERHLLRRLFEKLHPQVVAGVGK
jgi:hypothetical protein